MESMIDENQPAANRMSELPEATREFLSRLSKEDIATLEVGLPMIRMAVGFGKVTRWLAITCLGVMVGFVMFYESIVKILSWFKPPPS